MGVFHAQPGRMKKKTIRAGANYVVHYNTMTKDPVKCSTKDEVWDAIGKAGWGGYEVKSPIGLDVSEFIPF